jgi:predicted transposase/invertase (TIGR01784 family)
MNVLDKLPDAYQCDAFNKLKEVTDLSALDGKSLAEYEATRRNYWDTQTMYYEKHQEGRQEGIEEGRKLEREKADAEMLESKRSTARSLKENGIPISIIQQAVGLTEDEINAL